MQEKGLHAAGIGEGLEHSTGKQNFLKVVFNVDSLPDVEFARKLEVETLQAFLACINAQEGIQDYVAEYPFPLKFMQIGFISIHHEEGLFSVSNSENELIYRKDNPNQPIGPSIEVHSETYEEAVRILADSSNTHERACPTME